MLKKNLIATNFAMAIDFILMYVWLHEIWRFMYTLCFYKLLQFKLVQTRFLKNRIEYEEYKSITNLLNNI